MYHLLWQTTKLIILIMFLFLNLQMKLIRPILNKNSVVPMRSKHLLTVHYVLFNKHFKYTVFNKQFVIAQNKDLFYTVKIKGSIASTMSRIRNDHEVSATW